MDTTGRRNLRVERGEKLVTGGHVEMFAAGRVCEGPDCLTVLSRYNPSTLCGRHKGWDRPAGSRRERTTMDHPDELRVSESDLDQADGVGDAAPAEWAGWAMDDQGTDRR
jgi:hypothetical protein